MKSLLILTVLTLSQFSFAGNVVTDPASSAINTITPSASGVVGLTINGVSGSQPSCSSSTRGMLFVVRGGSGVADILQACMKASNGSYSWITK